MLLVRPAKTEVQDSVHNAVRTIGQIAVHNLGPRTHECAFVPPCHRRKLLHDARDLKDLRQCIVLSTDMMAVGRRLRLATFERSTALI